MHQFYNLQSNIMVEERELDSFLAFKYQLMVIFNLFSLHFQYSLFESFLSICLNLLRLQMNTNLQSLQRIWVIIYLQNCLFFFFHTHTKIIQVNHIRSHQNYKDDRYLLKLKYVFHHMKLQLPFCFEEQQL